MAMTEEDYRKYPGLRGYRGPLRKTFEHNIEMERKYGIPPGAESGNPKYADPNEFWGQQAGKKAGKWGMGKAA